MEPVPCCHCGEFFLPSPRHKNQIYCMKPECRRALKASWKRNRMRTDSDFRFNHKKGFYKLIIIVMPFLPSH